MERIIRNKVLNDFITARTNSDKGYNQFNGRTLFDFIDDSTKRWNGYIPEAPLLIDRDQSRIFLNFTRNMIISYIAKVGMSGIKSKIKAVNKKTGMKDEKMSEAIADLNRYSLDYENGEARFKEACLESTIKGTAIVYEGYKKQTQEMDVPTKWDAEKGKIETKKEKRTIFDNVYQELVPLEDFYIANPYQPDIQLQPYVLWRKITTIKEAEMEFKKYKNWQHVKAGSYTYAGDPTTFYRNKVITDLAQDQVEVMRYWNRIRNLYVLVVAGVVLYYGPIPFKDGKYPFAKYIFEPFEVPFFWGNSFPNKVMGEQDQLNTFINMMNDKMYGSLLPFGLSSDLDDIVEDDLLQVNKIRKVGDINKWKFDTLPGVSAGETSMFQQMMQLFNMNSGDITGAAAAATPKGGKVSARQAMLKQQEAMQRLGFSMDYLEDGERERTILRVDHILQFYSVPKIETITGLDGGQMQKLVYREVQMDDTTLSDGRKGTKILKMVDGDTANDPDKRMALGDELSVKEAMGDITGTPVEALALSVDTFFDYSLEIVIVKNSSYQQNQALDQAIRHEYANFRIGLKEAGLYDVNMTELVKYVDESYDLDSSRFEPDQSATPGVPTADNPGGTPGANGSPQNPNASGGGSAPQKRTMTGVTKVPPMGEPM